MTAHSLITIIGAGPAGLACARSLHDQNLDFVLLSPDLGGKLTYGPNKVPYGSYYIHQTYNHFRPFTTYHKRVWPWQGLVVGAKARITWRSVLTSSELFNMMRLRSKLLEFQKAYETYESRSLDVGPCPALQESRYLMDLANSCAHEFLATLVREGSAVFQLIEGNLKGFTFSSLKDLSALEALKYARNFVLPSYTFHFDAERFCQPFADRIQIGQAQTVRREGPEFLIETLSGQTLISRVVIDATNRSSDLRLEGITPRPGTGPNVSAFLYHVSGQRKAEFERFRFYGFTDDYDKNLLALTRERDGTSLIYLKHESEAYLGRFFSDYQIIGTKHWQGCMSMGKGRLPTTEPAEPGFIRAGALLFEGLEDAWISGLHAARVAANYVRSADTVNHRSAA